MKPLYFISLLLLLAAHAYADQRAVVTAGHGGPPAPLLPPAAQTDNCHLTVSNNTVDYGRIVQSPRSIALAPKTLQVTVSCLKATHLALTLQGQIAGQHYDLGSKGQLSVTLHDAVLDGRPVLLAQQGVNGLTQSESQSVTLSPLLGAVIPLFDHQPVQGKQLSLQLTTTGAVSTASHPVTQASMFQNALVLLVSQSP